MIWTILGFSCGFVAIFCITVAETLVGKPVFEQFRPYVAVGLGALGAVAWMIGRALETRDIKRTGTCQRFLLFDMRYWGPMLLVLGVITLFIRPLRSIKDEKPVMVVKAKEPAPAPEPPKKIEEPKPHVVMFPTMKMQGVIFREEKPFVILNGRSYTIGDKVAGVVVKAIDRSSVILEMEGQMKVLSLN